MIYTVVLSIIVSLVCIRGIYASKHSTTVIPLGLGTEADEGEVISGIFAGNGTDKTIYVLTPEVARSDDLPITATVIEKPSEFIVQFAASSADVFLTESVGCSFAPDDPSGLATCIEVLAEVSASQTASTMFTTSGFIVHASAIVSSGFITTSSSTSSATTDADASSGSTRPGSSPETGSGASTAPTQTSAGGRRRSFSTVASILMLLPVFAIVA
ncbi:hypothetical protein ACEPAF_2599 [Sanghuangporus sanghuang]